MINLNNISKTYPLDKGNVISAVRDVDLEIRDGEFLMIVGRSGSGKTTLLNLAAGLTRPTSGAVTIDGSDLWQMSDHEQSNLRNRTIGFAFQFPSLLPTLTSFENVMLPSSLFSKNSRSEKQVRASSLLEQVGLGDRLAAYPRQLSAGQQQRVVIARALMNQPKVLMADEPTANLDEKTETEIMELFGKLHKSLEITIVMVTHTLQLVSYGTRAIEMSNGQIVSKRPVGENVFLKSVTE